jgi:hypothetical protein
MSISELISDTIVSQFQSLQDSYVFLGGTLSSTDRINSRRIPGRFSFPLTPPISRDQPGSILKIRVPDIGLARRHLLWYLLFKGITVKEWLILSYLLELTLKGGRIGSCASFAGVLSLASKTRKGLDSWNSQLRPIHKDLSSKPYVNLSDKGEIKSLLDLVISELKIPQKALSKSELYSITKEPLFKRYPKDDPFIGVGYKDKGNLPIEDRPEPVLSEEIWVPTLNSRLEEALKYWKKIYITN